MQSPFFTIIIPTYNRADLISKTIDSVLGQGFRDFEIIVVDNKSTDNTAEVLKKYEVMPNIRVYYQPQNYERATSRNKGLAEARGRFVSLLDSDDILYPSCLQDAYDYHLAHPSFKFFHCGFQIIDDAGRVVTPATLANPANPFLELSKGNYISNIGLFIESSVTRRVTLDETPVLIGMEDYDFLMRILYDVKEVGFISKVNCGVLQHPGRTLLTQEFPAMEARVKYFVKKTLAGELFRHDFAPYAGVFKANNKLYLCGAAAVRGLSLKAFKYWLSAAGDHIPTIFTVKFWKHFFVIIKYIYK